MKNIFLPLLALLYLNGIAYSETNNDSLKVYRLGNISISGYANNKVNETSIYKVDQLKLRNIDLTRFSEIQQLIPSGRIRTNSRGESLMFLRGVGERSIGIFLDGIPLNIAWDNRVDLSMVPSEIIGQIDVNTNASSILLGANVLGGAINLNTFERTSSGTGVDFNLKSSLADAHGTSVTVSTKAGNFNSLMNLSYYKGMGNPNPMNLSKNINNQNIDDKYRNNTDFESINIYTRGEYIFSDNLTLGISYLGYGGEKGVAPETYLDSTSARYWRYPEYSRSLIGLNVEYKPNFDIKSVLRLNSWVDIFKQKIESYTNSSYKELKDIQNDDDKAFGTRLAYQIEFTHSNYVTASVNYLHSTHLERMSLGNKYEYSQNIYNFGFEYLKDFGGFLIKAGVVYDYLDSPKTGEYIDYQGLIQKDWGSFIDLSYIINQELSVYSNLSRRTRFPTMRESYTGGLNSFIVNPNLKAETGLLSELGVLFKNDIAMFKLSGFYTGYVNMITRIRLSKEVDSLRRRMRINLTEAYVYGTVLDFGIYPAKGLKISGNLTYMISKGKEVEIEKDWLDNRPAISGGLFVNYALMSGFYVTLEADIIADNYEADPNNSIQKIKLPSENFYNFKLSYNNSDLFNIYSEFYIRINNILDSYRELQNGLYDSGRTIYLGYKLSV